MTVRLTIDSSIAHLLLEQPERRNALSTLMFDALEDALTTLERDPAVHVLVLSGAGASFCSGFDLQEAIDDSTVLPVFIMRLSGVIGRLRRLGAVVIAAVHGHALAGGCAIVSAGDLVVAETHAKFGYPVHGLGVSPAVTLPTLISQLGPGAARALALRGEILTGRQAQATGLVHHLAPDGGPAVLEHAMSLARALAAKPPGALRATKAWVNELEGALESGRMHQPAQASATAASHPQARAALEAFWASRS